jgi:transposase-like protein
LGTSEILPEVSESSQIEDKPQRRVFTVAYKLAILEKLEECRTTRGAVGELLRKEGLYAAQVAKWKSELEETLSGALSKKRGPKPDPEAKAQKRIVQLEKQNGRLQEELRQARVVIEAQKKISEILGISQSNVNLEAEDEE